MDIDNKMIDRALQQIRMIKLAKRAPFYWGSPFDTDADAYDAVRQELIDSHKRLMSGFDPVTSTVKIKDTRIPLASINALYDAAWNNNDTLGRQRREFAGPLTYTGLIGGGLGGYWLGGKLGSGLVGWLNGSEEHKKIGKRIGNILGALAGAGLSLNMVNKYKKEHMPEVIDDGTSVLKDLNESISRTYKGRSGKSLKDSDKVFVDTTRPGSAVARKLGRG